MNRLEGGGVTIVAHDIGPVGGMERQLTELIRGVREAGHPVTVVSRTCVLPPDVEVRHVRVRGPARPFVIAYPWFLMVGTLLVALRRRGLLQVTGAIVLNRVDVAAVHLCHRGLARTGLLRAARESVWFRLNARAARRLSLLGERACYRPRRTRALAAVSSGVAAELREAYPRMADRVEVISNGVDTELFTPQPSPASDQLRAVFVGGEWEGKGLRFAIEALAEAPGWTLDVIGAGDQARYERLARDAGVADRVRFLGRLSNPETFYSGLDAFVLPSIYETFSLVTYEAAASGLPLLATRVSGIEDLIEDGVNGWFIGRNASSIAGRLRQLAEDPGLGESMGRAARESASRFTWERMVADHLDLYRRLA